MRFDPDRYCGCLDVLPLHRAVRHLLDEAGEWLRDPTFDEASDIAFAVGRLLGAAVKRAYVPVPGAGRHITKIGDRMGAYGCVRSRRLLVDGRCKSLSA